MSQNDFTIANQDFPSFRSDLNSALQALASTSSGTSAPSTTFANQLFYNTSTNILSIRNEDNDAFIPIALLDQSNDAITEIQCRGIAFSDGDNAMTIADGGACTFPQDVTVVGRAVGSTLTAANNAVYDLSVGNNFTTTTAATVTMNFSNVSVGQSGCIKFIQSGGHGVNLDNIVGMSATGFAALAVTGTYFLTYFVTASSGANSVLVGVSGALT